MHYRHKQRAQKRHRRRWRSHSLEDWATVRFILDHVPLDPGFRLPRRRFPQLRKSKASAKWEPTPTGIRFRLGEWVEESEAFRVELTAESNVAIPLTAIGQGRRWGLKTP